MDVHDGQVVQWADGQWWWYGMGYQNCTESVGFIPPFNCPGIYKAFGGCGFRVDHAVNVYTSPDLATWTFRGNVRTDNTIVTRVSARAPPAVVSAAPRVRAPLQPSPRRPSSGGFPPAEKGDARGTCARQRTGLSAAPCTCVCACVRVQALPTKARPNGIYFRPKVIFNSATAK